MIPSVDVDLTTADEVIERYAKVLERDGAFVCWEMEGVVDGRRVILERPCQSRYHPGLTVYWCDESNAPAYDSTGPARHGYKQLLVVGPTLTP